MVFSFDPLDMEFDKNQKFLESYPDQQEELLKKFTESEQKLLDQLAAVHEKLRTVRTERATKLAEMQDAKFAAIRRNKEIESKKLEQQEEGLIVETIQLVKEICEGFEAWSVARPYQVEDVIQIVHMYLQGASGIMNANEMALGKTFESLVALKIIIELHKRKNDGQLPKILWLTKLSLLLTGGTVNEVKRWFPELMIHPVKGSDPVEMRDMVFEVAEMGAMAVIANYEVIRNTKSAQKIKWDVVIMDEVHKLKGGANPKPSQIWTSIKNLDMGFTIMLTGTPLVNRIEEVWSYLHIFDAELFPDSKKFARQFSALRDIGGKLKFDINSEKLLKDMLRKRLIRRTAKEVGLQLPEEIFQEIMLDHNDEQGKIYEQMKERFFIWLEGQDEKFLTASSILAQLIRLRQINVLPVANFNIRDEEGNVIGVEKLDVRDSSKLDQALEIIQQTNDQVIVGCNFNEPLEELAFRCQVEGLRCAIISSKYADKMGDFEKEFQAGKIDVLLINLAMGEGMNLHKDKDKWEGGARAVIFLDKWYNDARNDQFKARAIRPGKTAGEPVFVYDLVVENSVDAYIAELCRQKSEQFGNLTGDKGLRPSEGFKAHLKRILG